MGVQPRQALMVFLVTLHPVQFIDLLLKYLYIYNNGSNKIVVVVITINKIRHDTIQENTLTQDSPVTQGVKALVALF